MRVTFNFTAEEVSVFCPQLLEGDLFLPRGLRLDREWPCDLRWGFGSHGSSPVGTWDQPHRGSINHAHVMEPPKLRLSLGIASPVHSTLCVLSHVALRKVTCPDYMGRGLRSPTSSSSLDSWAFLGQSYSVSFSCNKLYNTVYTVSIIALSGFYES